MTSLQITSATYLWASGFVQEVYTRPHFVKGLSAKNDKSFSLLTSSNFRKLSLNEPSRLHLVFVRFSWVVRATSTFFRRVADRKFASSFVFNFVFFPETSRLEADVWFAFFCVYVLVV
jgi:hypothetical protein